MRYLRQSTSVDVVIGPVWSTTDGALKSDLAYDATGINCDNYKNGTKVDISLRGTAGNGYLRPGSGEAQYILTLSTYHTNTIGSVRITLSAPGFYMRPEEFVVLHADVYDVLFGSVALATVGSAMTLAANQDVRIAEAVRDVDNASPAAGSLGAKVNSAASAGDPWSTTLPGSYSAGSAGKLVGDMAGTVSTNLDGKISSRAEPGDKMDLVDAPNATALTAIRTALQAAGSTLATLLSRIVGTLDSGTHKPQSGDAYGIVSDGTYGNPAIKSAIPAAAPTTTQIKNELEGSGSHLAAVKSTADKLESTLQSDGVSGHQFTATALENAPSGGGGSGEADWTADERKQIRSALGVTGATASTDSGELQALKSVVDTNLDAKISSRSAFDPASNKVTVATNEDKTGYALTSAYDRAKNAASNVEVTNATSGLSTLDGTDVEQALADYGTAKSSELPDAGPTAAQVADKLLGRNLAGGSDGGRTVRQALRPLRNRMEISEEDVMSVYKEDDATVDWEAAVTTDAAAEPITKVDPV